MWIRDLEWIFEDEDRERFVSAAVYRKKWDRF